MCFTLPLRVTSYSLFLLWMRRTNIFILNTRTDCPCFWKYYSVNALATGQQQERNFRISVIFLFDDV
jgi:hypothetical protein